MTISRIQFERFTAFAALDFAPSAGVNVFIGANGTGKTHIMKVAYAACDITRTGEIFPSKLVSAFLPKDGALGRLVKRQGKSSKAKVTITRQGGAKLGLSFSNHAKKASAKNVSRTGSDRWRAEPMESVFIPVKEMLANAPGFRSLYAQREIHFESIYADIIDRAFLPLLRGPHDQARGKLLSELQKSMDGKVVQKDEVFFLKNKYGELEFTLLAEGLRKLGLLWLLIQNGTLTKGAVLFWDEPETNLNPQLFSSVVSILLELQRMGVQIFVTTHDYAVMKEFELAATPDDKVQYHALYRAEGIDGVQIESRECPFELQNSPIEHAMTSLYDREIARGFSV